MVETLLIFAIGLVPSLCSLLVLRKLETQARRQFQTAINRPIRGAYPAGTPLSADHQYVEGIGYLLGDLSCRFNAKSAHIRCAVNPSGPCQECPYYEAIEFPN